MVAHWGPAGFVKEFVNSHYSLRTHSYRELTEPYIIILLILSVILARGRGRFPVGLRSVGEGSAHCVCEQLTICSSSVLKGQWGMGRTGYDQIYHEKDFDMSARFE